MSASAGKADDFFASVRDVLETGVKFKAAMKRKGKTRARVVCPRCNKFIWGAIASYNGHFRMSCEGNCGMAMME
jgi:hypothetical protein